MILRFPEVSLRVHVESVPWETHIWFSLPSFSARQKAYLSAHLSHSWVFDVDLKKKMAHGLQRHETDVGNPLIQSNFNTCSPGFPGASSTQGCCLLINIHLVILRAVKSSATKEVEVVSTRVNPAGSPPPHVFFRRTWNP